MGRSQDFIDSRYIRNSGHRITRTWIPGEEEERVNLGRAGPKPRGHCLDEHDGSESDRMSPTSKSFAGSDRGQRTVLRGPCHPPSRASAVRMVRTGAGAWQGGVRVEMICRERSRGEQIPATRCEHQKTPNSWCRFLDPSLLVPPA